ncbi:MAG: nuclear transport factor 2 family protein [Oxalobacteraceae bacterium]
MSIDPRLQQLIRFFEQIDPSTVSQLSEVYTPDAFFKDPFNEVHGIAAITHIFRHMFDQVDSPRFVVTDSVMQGEQAFLTWDFLFRMKRFSATEQCIRGATHIRFAADGRVNFHRDYWDAAEELYEKLPVLGGLMRALKRLANR